MYKFALTALFAAAAFAQAGEKSQAAKAQAPAKGQDAKAQAPSKGQDAKGQAPAKGQSPALVVVKEKSVVKERNGLFARLQARKAAAAAAACNCQ